MRMSADTDWERSNRVPLSYKWNCEWCGLPSFAKAAKDGICLAGFGCNRWPKHGKDETCSPVHGNEIVGFAHAGNRKRVRPFEIGADAIREEGLGLAGIGKLDDGQKHAELRAARIDRHVRCYGDQCPDSCFQYADGAAEEVLRLAALGIGDKWLPKKIMLHIGEGDVAAF